MLPSHVLDAVTASADACASTTQAGLGGILRLHGQVVSWFAFNIDFKSLVLMEKKGVPNHLQSLPCIDNPTDLGTVIRELEDAGEVGAHMI